MTGDARPLYVDVMRVLWMVLLLVGLGFGVVPTMASASPCPHHAQMASTMLHEARAEQASVTSVVHVVTAANDLKAVVFAQPIVDHIIPEGLPCCHAASAAVQVLGPAVAPYQRSSDRVFSYGRLPPWVAPTSDIFRPPASA